MRQAFKEVLEEAVGELPGEVKEVAGEVVKEVKGVVGEVVREVGGVGGNPSRKFTSRTHPYRDASGNSTP